MGRGDDDNRRRRRRQLRTLAMLALAVCAAGPLAAAAPAPAQASAEGDVMQQVRAALDAIDPALTAAFKGWQLNDTSHHCTWKGVFCDERRRVARLVFGWAGSIQLKDLTHSSPHSLHPYRAMLDKVRPLSLLLPQLAQLQWLQELSIEHGEARLLSAALPPEWLLPGAFPRLAKLNIQAASAAAPLPDIPPGSLPALRALALRLPFLHSTLPSSWGTLTNVLPSLTSLVVDVQLEGELPAGWSQGFGQLDALFLTKSPLEYAMESGVEADADAVDAAGAAPLVPAASGTPPTRPPQHQEQQGQGRPAFSGADTVDSIAGSTHTFLPNGPAQKAEGTYTASAAIATAAIQPAAGAPPALGRTLPREWGQGFPKLRDLRLVNLGLEGPFPEALLSGSLRSLQSLELSYSALTGTLPPHLFERQPDLDYLMLEGNQFTGTLPPEWGTNKSSIEGLLLPANRLTGPAFPPAWLQPGSLPHLRVYDMSRNKGLTGTLPANLSWPLINTLHTYETGLTGTIPAGWCSKARPTIQRMWIDAAFDPTLPPCAATALPDLLVQIMDGKLHAAPKSPPTASPTSNNGALFASLAAVLLLCAMAAATAAAQVAWQLRRLQQQKQQGPVWHGGWDVEEGQEALEGPGAGTGAAAGTEAALGSAHAGGQHSAAGPAAVLPPEALLPVERWWLLQGGSSNSDGVSSFPSSLLPAGTPLYSGSWSAGESSVCSCGSPPTDSWHLPPNNSLRLAPADLELLLDRDGLLVQLGCGRSSMVYLARMQGRLVAVKVLELSHGADAQAVWQEAAILKHCAHPRILPLYGVALKGPLVVLVTELMEGGSLRDALQTPSMQAKLQWGARGCQVALDVAEGLHFLHSEMRVMHSDLKAANVLLTRDCRASLADLGLAQVLASHSGTAAGFTSKYASPEQLMGQRCTLAADMYSFGILLVELTTQRLVDNRQELRLPSSPQECPQGVVDLILDCLAGDPLKRPTAQQALQRLQAAATSA